MPPDEPNDEERLEELPGDQGTPFQPADDQDDQGQTDDTHPSTDVDQQELYDEGVAGAEAEEPNQDNAVTGYEPDESKEDKQL